MCGHDFQGPPQLNNGGTLHGNVLVESVVGLIFRPSHHPVYNGLQCAKMERGGETVLK